MLQYNTVKGVQGMNKANKVLAAVLGAIIMGQNLPVGASLSQSG